mmetsp:Transcript_10053/g.29478  ORF Transcript_10053/g.29478 Transcript_10053/m.29478 type:complete len:217 (-) Transcript_10053:2847-3497(-)
MLADEVLVFCTKVDQCRSIQNTVIPDGDRSRSSTSHLQPPERHALARFFVTDTLDRYRREGALAGELKLQRTNGIFTLFRHRRQEHRSVLPQFPGMKIYSNIAMLVRRHLPLRRLDHETIGSILRSRIISFFSINGEAYIGSDFARVRNFESFSYSFPIIHQRSSPEREHLLGDGEAGVHGQAAAGRVVLERANDGLLLEDLVVVVVVYRRRSAFS